MCESAWLFAAQNTRPKTQLSKVPSLCSCQSQHANVLVLHIRSLMVAEPWPSPPVILSPSDEFALRGSQKLGYMEKLFMAISRHCCMYMHTERKRRISRMTCTFITESVEREKMICMQFKPHILWFSDGRNGFKNIPWAMFSGPMLTPGAKCRVTGSAALGQKSQSKKDVQLRLGVRPARQGEVCEAGCQELRLVMAPLTILNISLPPKHLTCSIRHYTNKQTDAHTIQINTQRPRDTRNANKHRQENITQRPINPWLQTKRQEASFKYMLSIASLCVCTSDLCVTSQPQYVCM